MFTRPFGLWIDDPPRVALRPGYIDRLARLGITRVAVMVQRSPRGKRPEFRQTWTRAQLERFGGLLRLRRIRLTLTIWPQPSPAALRASIRQVRPLLEATGADGLELDAEGNWTSARVVGFRSIVEAARAWKTELRTLRDRTGVRLELTTFPHHPENREGALLAPICDLLLPQAYAVRHRRSRGKRVLVDFDGLLGPEQIPGWAMAHADLAGRGDVPVGAGLALYDTAFPEASAEDSMRIAYRSAVSGGACELRGWSSKWAIGVRRQAAAERFLEWATAPGGVR